MTKTPKSTKQMQSVQAYLEIGHWAWCRSPEKRQKMKSHDWVLFVRGKEDNQAIHHFVEKVVIHLHESFVPSTRVITEPPYQISESGYGSFIVNIEVHFRMKESGQRSMQTYNHDLTLPAEGNPPIELALTEKLTFTLVSEEFIEMVLKGGGKIIQTSVSNHVASKPSSNFSRNQLKVDSKSKVLKQQKKKLMKVKALSVMQTLIPEPPVIVEDTALKKVPLKRQREEKESISKNLFQDVKQESNTSADKNNHSINTKTTENIVVTKNTATANKQTENTTDKKSHDKEWRAMNRLCQQITTLKGDKSQKEVLYSIYKLLSSNTPSTNKAGDKVFNLCHLNRETYDKIKHRLKV